MTWATDRLDGLIAGGVELPPVVTTLGLGVVEAWGPGWVRKGWTPRPEVLNGDGSLFGGYLAALADQVLAFATMTVVPDTAYFRTTQLQIQFFRVGRAHPLEIEARVLAQTKQLISVEADFRRPDGELIAKASAQQVLTPNTALAPERTASGAVLTAHDPADHPTRDPLSL
ncbi:PaaI family thioesterase [Phenylobacterium aquaticum]|uniref:PaaI family thioesterase n=1 Tax=Phenylobacterium aquaticum TaxID=1763816 RepID=UPI001F5DDEB0|nr:PaaI family thioesterase [Phenylobacterium aquaticum]MCI3133960.1 PaaI family thioesterase [Phenylobacterium aquaticum]